MAISRQWVSRIHGLAKTVKSSVRTAPSRRRPRWGDRHYEGTPYELQKENGEYGNRQESPSAPGDRTVPVAPPEQDSRSGVFFAAIGRYSTVSKPYRCKTDQDARQFGCFSSVEREDVPRLKSRALRGLPLPGWISINSNLQCCPLLRDLSTAWWAAYGLLNVASRWSHRGRMNVLCCLRGRHG